MTRSGKGEERPNQSATRHISLEDFMFTRDHVSGHCFVQVTDEAYHNISPVCASDGSMRL